MHFFCVMLNIKLKKNHVPDFSSLLFRAILYFLGVSTIIAMSDNEGCGKNYERVFPFELEYWRRRVGDEFFCCVNLLYICVQNNFEMVIEVYSWTLP